MIHLLQRKRLLAVVLVSTALGACGNAKDGAAASASAESSPAAKSSAASSSKPQMAVTAAATGKDAPLRDVPASDKSTTAKFCLGADGTSQDCAISCKIDRDRETCDKWAEKTKAICAKITKKECQEICEKDENPTACEIAKTMK